jgi:hypothetical protein
LNAIPGLAVRPAVRRIMQHAGQEKAGTKLPVHFIYLNSRGLQ